MELERQKEKHNNTVKNLLKRIDHKNDEIQLLTTSLVSVSMKWNEGNCPDLEPGQEQIYEQRIWPPIMEEIVGHETKKCDGNDCDENYCESDVCDLLGEK